MKRQWINEELIADACIKTFGAIDWEPLHTALLGKGWSDLGHPEWGSMTLGQTNPTLSNGGLLAITLMTYAYVHKTRGPQFLTPDYIDNNPALWDYIEVFERAVDTFGESSGSYFTGTVLPQGTSHSLAITYENLVLLYQDEAQRSGGEPLEIFYPSQEAISDHPFAILSAPWVSTEQQAAAKQFLRFLLSREQQVQALKYAFRPADESISLTDATIQNNPFKRLRQLAPASSFDPRKSATVAPPRGDVVDALITQWQQHNQGV